MSASKTQIAECLENIEALGEKYDGRYRLLVRATEADNAAQNTLADAKGDLASAVAAVRLNDTSGKFEPRKANEADRDAYLRDLLPAKYDAVEAAEKAARITSQTRAVLSTEVASLNEQKACIVLQVDLFKLLEKAW